MKSSFFLGGRLSRSSFDQLSDRVLDKWTMYSHNFRWQKTEDDKGTSVFGFFWFDIKSYKVIANLKIAIMQASYR